MLNYFWPFKRKKYLNLKENSKKKIFERLFLKIMKNIKHKEEMNF
jgi:hypothetical protein